MQLHRHFIHHTAPSGTALSQSYYSTYYGGWYPVIWVSFLRVIPSTIWVNRVSITVCFDISIVQRLCYKTKPKWRKGRAFQNKVKERKKFHSKLMITQFIEKFHVRMEKLTRWRKRKSNVALLKGVWTHGGFCVIFDASICIDIRFEYWMDFYHNKCDYFLLRFSCNWQGKAIVK